ncbi:MAG TPA: hypothetical protein VNZ55_14450 [Thermomicrobiales bacterium]|nr:hypothetical protein [Thermomicrobiales bacterium]
MTNVHMIVGSLVVIGFIVTLVLNIMSLVNGRVFPWQRSVSFAAATLLLLQYVLGFSLLGEGKDIPGTHYLIALLAILGVGLEHGYASTREDPKQRSLYAVIANVITLVLVLIAYMIGQSNGS